MRVHRFAAAVLVLLLSAFSAPALVITEVYTTDFILLYSCGYYLSVDPHPNTIGTFAAPQWSVLGNNEPVHVIAHGQQGSIGVHNPMDGAKFAAWIAAPPSYTIQIFAESCESAVESSSGPSLITGAADASRSTRRFTGYAGCSITDRVLGMERVVKPSMFDVMAIIQEKLETQMNPQGQIDAFVKDYKAKHGGADPPLPLLAQTAYGNKVIRDFFAALLKEGDAQGCLYNAGQGIVTKQGKLAAAPRRKKAA